MSLSGVKVFRNSEIIAVSIAIAIALSFSIFDLVHDFNTGSTTTHIVIDLVLSFAMLGVLIKLLSKINKNAHRLGSLQVAVNESRKEAETSRLRAEQLQVQADESEKIKSKFQNGLSEFIDLQFTKWQLSEAEKEIALLLLKGLSHQEIADLRNTGEKTVRQQSLSIYKKAGINGRTDLAAFFLEDLLNPINIGIHEKTLS